MTPHALVFIICQLRKKTNIHQLYQTVLAWRTVVQLNATILNDALQVIISVLTATITSY